MAGVPVREPWPYDLELNGNGVMLAKPAPNAPGKLIAVRPQTLDQVAPPEFLDDAMNPMFARPQVYEDMSLGFGRKFQIDAKDRFYFYTINADLSQEHKWLKGPAYTTATPGTVDSTNGITDFVEIGGHLYWLNGRYMQKRGANDSTTTQTDFGSGSAGLTARLFRSGGGTPSTDVVFVSMGSQTDRQTITIGGSPTGGTYTLTYNGNTTSSIAYNANASTVQTALQALTGLGSVTVAQTGSSPNVVNTVTMTGVSLDPLRITATSSLTGGSPTITMGYPDKDWYFDGTSWTQMQTFHSLDYVPVGREFYRASDVNLVSKVDTNADPTNESNWTSANQFRIGDKTSAIVRLGVTSEGVLIVFKTDGMYSLDGDGQDIRYFPFLQFNPNPNGDSCKQIGYYENSVYVQYNGALYSIDPSFQLQHCGPELEVTNDGPVRGYVTATFGYQSLNMYAGIWNPDTSESYLMKYGSWLSGRFSSFTGNVIETPLGQRIDAWHGSITPAFSSKITAMWVSAIGAAAGHNRLWVGFADGSYLVFTLPCTPDPSACTQYAFSLTDGQVFLPLFTATWLGEPKALRKFVVMSPNLTSTNYVHLQYMADNNIGSYVELGTNFTQSPRQQVNFPNNISGSMSNFKVILVNSSSTTTCPQVMGCVLYFAVRPEFLLEYDYTVMALDGLVDRTGHPLRAQATEIEGWVKDACSTTGSVTTVLPDEVSKQIAYIGYQETVGWDDRTQQYGKALAIKGYELVTNVTYGTWLRVEAYTWDAISAYTWNQLENL